MSQEDDAANFDAQETLDKVSQLFCAYQIILWIAGRYFYVDNYLRTYRWQFW